MRIVVLAPMVAILAMMALGGAAGAGEPIDKSPLSGMVFEEKPVRLEDKGAFRDLMARVTTDAKRSCGPLEIYGWEVPDDNQDRVDKLADFVRNYFNKNRFLVREAKAAIIWHADAEAFAADKDGTHLMVLLSLSPSPDRERTSDLVLLICEAPFLPQN
ncbi:MAG: hypothetical protein WCJ64_11325 [Rhodospirillaceae bacterium]